MGYKFDLATAIDEFYREYPVEQYGIQIIDTADMNIFKRIREVEKGKKLASKYYSNLNKASPPEDRNAITHRVYEGERSRHFDPVSERLIFDKSASATQVMDVHPLQPRASMTQHYSVVLPYDKRATLTDFNTLMSGVKKEDLNPTSEIKNDVFQYFVFDHEIGHAFSERIISKKKSDLFHDVNEVASINYSETIADTYSILRGIQRWGDKCGIGQQIMSLRTVEAFESGGLSHYTTPALEKIIPDTQKVDFKNLKPKELADLAVKLTDKHFDPGMFSDLTFSELQANLQSHISRFPVKVNINPLNYPTFFKVDRHVTLKAPRLVTLRAGRKLSLGAQAKRAATLGQTTKSPVVHKICEDWQGAMENLGVKDTKKINFVREQTQKNKKPWEKDKKKQNTLSPKPTSHALKKTGASPTGFSAPKPSKFK